MRESETYGCDSRFSTDHSSVGSGDIGKYCGSSDCCRAEDLGGMSVMSQSWTHVEHTVFVAETVAVSTASVMVVVPVL